MKYRCKDSYFCMIINTLDAKNAKNQRYNLLFFAKSQRYNSLVFVKSQRYNLAKFAKSQRFELLFK